MCNDFCIKVAYKTKKIIKKLLGNPLENTKSFKHPEIYKINEKVLPTKSNKY